MRAFFFSLLIVFAAAVPASGQQPAGRILSVRFGTVEGGTRMVIDSDKPLTYSAFSLAGGSQRIVVDLPRVRWSLDGLTAESGSGAGKGVVSGFRYAQNTASSSRLVLDLASPASISRDYALEPTKAGETYRIVMDLESVTPAAFTKKAEADLAAPRTEVRRAARKPKIVIDPGHGGKDPGASSKDGLREKDVTLAIATALRKQLQETKRYDVALTRSTDEFIELDQRVEKARALGADLFISLHADAGANANVRGASVYTLSSKGEKRAETIRHQNDWVMAVETDRTRSTQVNQILADLVQRETKNQSARFAQALIPALADAGWPALQNTHRNAGYFVLLAPDVPAVLLEMGFMTNTSDAAMLTSDSKRRKLVAGITSAIDGFFHAETQVLAQR